MTFVRPTGILNHHGSQVVDSGSVTATSPTPQIKDKFRRVRSELTRLGVSKLAMMRSEMRELPNILHDDEHLEAVIYGRDFSGFVILVATDRRVLYIDKKLMFMNVDELSYNLVGGISYGRAGLYSTITLHTQLNDYQIRTGNWPIARDFIDFIETRCLDN